MIPARHILLTGILLISSTALLVSQQREASDWFLRQMFILSDFNGDGQLSKAEASQVPTQWNYYTTAAGFAESDRDHDQLLSRSEMEQTAWKALVFRLSQDEQELRRLQQEFSHLRQAQSKYLERYPGLARHLLQNVVWCRENDHLVKKLIKNRAWFREQPEAADALQNNLIFWMEHPKIAAQYYEKPPAGNDAALYEAWRTGHRRYLSSLETLPHKSILDFRHFAAAEGASVAEERPIVTSVSPPPTALEVARLSNTHEVDSLRSELQKAEDEIQQLEQLLEVVNNVPVSDMDDDQVKDELRMLQVELRLARVEEDSLLAEVIRSRRQISHLKGRIVADSLAAVGRQPVGEESAETLEAEIKQLRGFISSQAVEMESLTGKLRQTQRKLVQEQEKLAQMSAPQVLEPVQEGPGEELVHLADQVTQQKDSLATYQEKLDRLTMDNRSRRLRNDSLRLELVQAGLQRQAVMDSLALLIRVSRIQSDSIAYWSALAATQLQEEGAQDSLLAALRRSEKERALAVTGYQNELDSLSQLLVEVRRTAVSPAVEDLAFRDGTSEQLREVINNLQESQEGLQYDNTKLRQQLEATMVVSREQEEVLREQLNAVLKNNRRLEYQNRKLQRRLSSRRLPGSTTAVARMDEANFELTEARAQIAELESVNERLLIQLQTTQGYILQKLREEGNSNRRLADEMQEGTAARFKADTLSIALANALRNSWPDTVAMLRSELKEIARQKEALEETAILARSKYLQQRDSLVKVIDARDLELIRRNRVDNVDEQRFARIQAKESELEILEKKLQAKQQLLDQREQFITSRLEEIEEQQARFDQLDAWEAELKRREQVLRVRNGGNE